MQVFSTAAGENVQSERESIILPAKRPRGVALSEGAKHRGLSVDASRTRT